MVYLTHLLLEGKVSFFDVNFWTCSFFLSEDNWVGSGARGCSVQQIDSHLVVSALRPSWHDILRFTHATQTYREDRLCILAFSPLNMIIFLRYRCIMIRCILCLLSETERLCLCGRWVHHFLHYLLSFWCCFVFYVIDECTISCITCLVSDAELFCFLCDRWVYNLLHYLLSVWRQVVLCFMWQMSVPFLALLA